MLFGEIMNEERASFGRLRVKRLEIWHIQNDKQILLWRMEFLFFYNQNINWCSNISTYNLRFYLLPEHYQGSRWKHFGFPHTLQQYLGAIRRAQANRLSQL